MSTIDRPSNPETPWEFLPDDLEPPMPIAAEDGAMHYIGLSPPEVDTRDDDIVVHYLDDEHPEVPDPTAPVIDVERTAEVDELLIRQHYLLSSDDDET